VLLWGLLPCGLRGQMLWNCREPQWMTRQRLIADWLEIPLRGVGLRYQTAPNEVARSRTEIATTLTAMLV
jgi:hypothetical protein